MNNSFVYDFVRAVIKHGLDYNKIKVDPEFADHFSRINERTFAKTWNVNIAPIFAGYILTNRPKDQVLLQYSNIDPRNGELAFAHLEADVQRERDALKKPPVLTKSVPIVPKTNKPNDSEDGVFIHQNIAEPFTIAEQFKAAFRITGKAFLFVQSIDDGDPSFIPAKNRPNVELHWILHNGTTLRAITIPLHCMDVLYWLTERGVRNIRIILTLYTERTRSRTRVGDEDVRMAHVKSEEEYNTIRNFIDVNRFWAVPRSGGMNVVYNTKEDRIHFTVIADKNGNLPPQSLTIIELK